MLWEMLKRELASPPPHTLSPIQHATIAWVLQVMKDLERQYGPASLTTTASTMVGTTVTAEDTARRQRIDLTLPSVLLTLRELQHAVEATNQAATHLSRILDMWNALTPAISPPTR